jgi:DNA-binding response OmpR family regulator
LQVSPKNLELMKNFSVLFVEDDDTLRQTMTKIFKRLFKRVDEARDGEEGYTLYTHFKEETNTFYNIVISDIEMPKMSGIELCKKIVSLHPKQQIIVTSAYSEKEYFIELINIGVSGFFQKPINDVNMFNVLEKVTLSLSDINRISLGENIEYDITSHTLYKEHTPLELSSHEQKLLELLCQHQSQYFSAIDIFNHIHYDDIEKEFSHDSIKSLIKRLRKKLPSDMIINTPSLGYALNAKKRP